MDGKPVTKDEMPGWRRPIPQSRDQAQSKTLTWTVGLLLLMGALAPPLAALRLSLPLWAMERPVLVSAGFAGLVLLLRAATPAAAAIGFLICFIFAQAPAAWAPYTFDVTEHWLLQALMVLFVLTFAATRYGRTRKEARGLSESRRGRSASQIVANLGVAGLFAAAGWYEGCVAALAEAAADTVSSEIGQALGHTPRLVTTGRRVAAGTDGGVTFAGTVAGLLAAAMVVAVGSVHHPMWPEQVVTWIAASAGLYFDSLLGATLERRGWMGNDLVNFASTLFAAAIASSLAR